MMEALNIPLNGVIDLMKIVVDYAKWYAECPVCRSGFDDDDKVTESMGGCDHLYHEQCMEFAIQHAHNNNNHHVQCAQCTQLHWADIDHLGRGISLHRREVDNILYHGKRIENRSQQFRAGYYWLRATMEADAAHTQRGHIVALIRLHEHVDDVSPDQEKWVIEHYSFHFPISIVWILPQSIEWVPRLGTQSRFRLNSELLHRLIRY